VPFAWRDKRVLVTGGAGFLGRFVVEKLAERGCTRIFVPRRREWDLRDPRAVEGLFAEARPQLVLHLAGMVGGIGANEREPGRR
jgi:GDP-L-fucose synthase